MSTQPIPTSHAIGELFGFRIPTAPFFGLLSRPITDTSSTINFSDESTQSPQFVDTLSSSEQSKLQAFLVFVCMSPQGEALAERILLHLDRAEYKSRTATERDDLRTAWMTVNLAFYHNYANPYFTAFCRIFGQTPEKMQQQIDRYEAFMLRNEVVAATLPPRKPVASVTIPQIAKGAAGGR